MTPPIWECSHNRQSQPRARTYASGIVQHRRQCLDCGSATGTAVSKADALNETRGHIEPFDEELFDEGREQARIDALERQQERDVERAEWWNWYNNYLNSPEWHDRRRKVLERARGICEGCGDRRAVHVHHTTYAHVGNELLFELAALCEQCHELAHSKNPTAMPTAMWLDPVGPA